MQDEEVIQQILGVVMLIPKGKVATYGQIAAMVGLPKHARFIGYTLKRLSPQSDVPWHRVINAQGRISIVGEREGINRNEQRERLIVEGIDVINGKISLKKFRWCY